MVFIWDFSRWGSMQMQEVNPSAMVAGKTFSGTG
jgi:hypothetical protein